MTQECKKAYRDLETLKHCRLAPLLELHFDFHGIVRKSLFSITFSCS
jgi:hypothetical protein